MFEPLIKAIQESVAVETFTDRVRYYSRPVFLPPPGRRAETVELSTISGLLRFEEIFSEIVSVHVESPTRISLVGELDQDLERQTYAQAIVQDSLNLVGSIPSGTGQMTPFLGRYHAIADLLIGVRTFFVNDAIESDDEGVKEMSNLDQLIQKLGTVSKGKVVTLEDDGFTQAVSTKNSILSGSTLSGKTEMPVELELIPKRSFGEIPTRLLPTSKFLLRFRSEASDAMPTAGLFELDYNGWYARMIKAVGEFIEASNPGVTIWY
jgi:hypothetical protein